TIAINNPSNTPVRFAVWNEKGGQANGIQWIDAKQSSSGLWTGNASCEYFKDDGKYIVHAYSGSKMIGGSTFEWNAKKAQLKLNSNMEMFNIAQTLDSPTQYLIVLNRAIHRVAIYQGSAGNWKEIYYWPCVVGKPSTPTPAGLFHIKGRFDWFGDGHKSWWATQIEGYYYFHSQIYYWDDAPRVVLDPAMDTAASAGCVRLYEPNALWIYRNIPRNTTVYIY
ncbi:MAG: L,D-transpeptidase family protein, partial [Parasporobacterium sp.]|nr:L,D-transpeptidase family protein [Parasporobacterium sp.]